MRSNVQAGSLIGAGLDEIVYALRRSRKTVEIATPFMSHPVAALLVRESAMIHRRRLLIALNDAAVQGGYLDPRGVDEFVAGEFEVRSLRNLHAKLVVADRRWALVGSGNLTVAGSNGGNAELGVVLGPSHARRAGIDHFDHWWAAAHPLDLSRLRTLKRTRRPSSPENHQRKGQGGFFETNRGSELDAFVDDPSRGGYWLKIMHHRPEREPVTTGEATSGSVTFIGFVPQMGSLSSNRRIA
jgi:phosphatidylserine/phosphatidylglycerophosphate/cardiolipin synthase-like enzyme